MKKHILITGGAGFIGSHVVRRFVKNYPDYKIINFDDKKYLKDVNSFLRKVNCYEKGDASKKVVDKMNKLIK